MSNIKVSNLETVSLLIVHHRKNIMLSLTASYLQIPACISSICIMYESYLGNIVNKLETSCTLSPGLPRLVEGVLVLQARIFTFNQLSGIYIFLIGKRRGEEEKINNGFSYHISPKNIIEFPYFSQIFTDMD